MDTMTTIERKLRHLEQFRGANLRSECEVIDGQLYYTVYSYRTLIAMFTNDRGAVLNKYYSRTTTKHQKLIATAWRLAGFEVRELEEETV